jgi:hypothetical protein
VCAYFAERAFLELLRLIRMVLKLALCCLCVLVGNGIVKVALKKQLNLGPIPWNIIKVILHQL